LQKEVPAEAPVRRASDPDVDRIWTDVIEKVSDGFSGEKNALQDEFARLREGALAGMAALKERVESAPVAHMKRSVFRIEWVEVCRNEEFCNLKALSCPLSYFKKCSSHPFALLCLSGH
jgi:hypothetical protein